MVFQYINICQVPREMLKTSAYGLGFQHLPRDLANVNAWKSMFDPYIQNMYTSIKSYVTVNSESSSTFPCNIGVREGEICPLCCLPYI